jgi:hypothetical protein
MAEGCRSGKRETRLGGWAIVRESSVDVILTGEVLGGLSWRGGRGRRPEGPCEGGGESGWSNRFRRSKGLDVNGGEVDSEEFGWRISCSGRRGRRGEEGRGA